MPTSLLMALDYFGKDKLSDQRVLELHKRTRTNRLNIPGILRDYGLFGDASYSPYWTLDDIKKEIDDGLPMILGLDNDSAGHIVLAVGYTDDGKVIINDPGVKNGDHVTCTLEEIIFDGGGVKFREVPIAPYQAEWVAAGRLGWENEDTRHKIWIEYRNRGTETWPAGKVELHPTGLKQPISLFYDAETWLSTGCVARVDRDVKPGETYRFDFSVKTPKVTTPTEFHQPFHLFLNPDTPFSYPRDQDVGIEPRIWPVFALPIEDFFQQAAPSLFWLPRFTTPQIVKRDDSPNGHGTALCVEDPKEGGYDSIRVGNLDGQNYRVSATLYCDYRPLAESDGFERVGIFARDNYRGDFDKKGLGNEYILTFDSQDGRVRMGKCVRGDLVDFLSSALYIRQSGWHEFSIACHADHIMYFMDGKRLLEVEDHFRSDGLAGVGYHEFYTDNTLAQGALVAKFRMEAF